MGGKIRDNHNDQGHPKISPLQFEHSSQIEPITEQQAQDTELDISGKETR